MNILNMLNLKVKLASDANVLTVRETLAIMEEL
jgi:hypothetical protein